MNPELEEQRERLRKSSEKLMKENMTKNFTRVGKEPEFEPIIMQEPKPEVSMYVNVYDSENNLRAGIVWLDKSSAIRNVDDSKSSGFVGTFKLVKE